MLYINADPEITKVKLFIIIKPNGIFLFSNKYLFIINNDVEHRKTEPNIQDKIIDLYILLFTYIINQFLINEINKSKNIIIFFDLFHRNCVL